MARKPLVSRGGGKEFKPPPVRIGVPKPKPKPKPPAKKPPAKTPVPPAAGTPASGAPAGHPTLDIAAMSAAPAPADQTQVTQTGGPQQEGAVFSTGAGSAPQLSYQQTTTYQEVYAQQQAAGGQTGSTG